MKGQNVLNFYYLVLLKYYYDAYVLANDNLHCIHIKVFQMQCTHENQLKFYCLPDLQIPSSLFLIQISSLPQLHSLFLAFLDEVGL